MAWAHLAQIVVAAAVVAAAIVIAVLGWQVLTTPECLRGCL